MTLNELIRQLSLYSEKYGEKELWVFDKDFLETKYVDYVYISLSENPFIRLG